MEFIGWVGSFLLAFCGLPLAVKSYIQKHSEGISALFLWMWGLGEVAVLIYVIPGLQWPLIANYTANLIFVGIIAWYKVYPSKIPQKVPENQ